MHLDRERLVALPTGSTGERSGSGRGACTSARAATPHSQVPPQLPRPEARKRKLQRVERFGAHESVVPPDLDCAESVAVETEDFECARDGIDEPQVADGFARVDGHLVGTIGRGRGRGQHFAYPVRRKVERCSVGHLGHASASPASKIGNEDVAAQVELGLIEDDPATQSVIARIEGSKLDPQAGGCPRVWGPWTRMRDDFAIHDLGDEVVGDGEEIFVGRLTTSGRDHGRSIMENGAPATHVARVAPASLTSGLVNRSCAHAGNDVRQ